MQTLSTLAYQHNGVSVQEFKVELAEVNKQFGNPVEKKQTVIAPFYKQITLAVTVRGFSF